MRCTGLECHRLRKTSSESSHPASPDARPARYRAWVWRHSTIRGMLLCHQSRRVIPSLYLLIPIANARGIHWAWLCYAIGKNETYRESPAGLNLSLTVAPRRSATSAPPVDDAKEANSCLVKLMLTPRVVLAATKGERGPRVQRAILLSPGGLCGVRSQNLEPIGFSRCLRSQVSVAIDRISPGPP